MSASFHSRDQSIDVVGRWVFQDGLSTLSTSVWNVGLCPSADVDVRECYLGPYNVGQDNKSQGDKGANNTGRRPSSYTRRSLQGSGTVQA